MTKKIFLILVVVAVVVGGAAFFFKKDKPASVTTQPETTQVKDTVAPTVSINNIVEAQEVSGIFTIKVDSADSVGVSKVEYYVDGEFKGVSYAQPFEFNLDTTKLAEGGHTIYAKAYDAAGNATPSKTISFVVPAQAPVVAETPPKKVVAVSTTTSASTSIQSGGQTTPTPTPAPEPTPPDTTAPTQPTGVLLSASNAYVVNVNWTPSTDAVGVTEYDVYRDGSLLGDSAAANYSDYTVVPGNNYAYSVVAKDAAGNESTESNDPDITLATTSIWTNADHPALQDDDPSTLEVGVKFRPLVNGKINGIRFYKATGAQSVHTVKLWAGGSNVATATTVSETASGWQTATFATPYDVVAGTTYIASYYAADGVYSYIPGYFGSHGISTQYLTALASGVDGNNGVFRYGSTGLPTTSYDNTSYMVDVTFTPNPSAPGPAVTVANNSVVFPGFPGSNNTGLAAGQRLPVRDRGYIVYRPNVTIEKVDIRDANTNKCIDVRSTNTTIDQVKMACSGAFGVFQDPGYSGLVVKDSEVTSLSNVTPADRALLVTGGATVQRVYVHGTMRGIWVGDGTTVEDTFVGDNVFSSSGHATAIATAGGANNVIVRRNNFRTGNNTNATASLSFYPEIAHGGANDNFLIDSNLFASGGDYCVYMGHQAGVEQPNTNFVFTNNKFGTDINANCGIVGPVASWSTGATGNVWTNNRWLGGSNDGQLVAEP